MKNLFLFLFLFAFPSHIIPAQNLESKIYGEIAPFNLTKENGNSLTLEGLKGKFWVADFIFTRCQGHCPLLTQKMALLKSELPKDAQVVTFSVDPVYDTPQILSQYAQEHSIATDQWHFLTGEKAKVYDLIRTSFKIGAEEDPNGKTISEQFIHSTFFVLVDPEGKIRSYYDGLNPATIKQIPLEIKIAQVQISRPWVLKLPRANAALNLSCAALLLLGFQFIRKKIVLAHRACMGTAFLISALFLTSYLTYHYFLGSVPFLEEGGIRSLYFTLLISHTILAILVLPLALMTFYFAVKGNFNKHKSLAHWTFPLWLYVSLSGVTVYYMLYHP